MAAGYSPKSVNLQAYAADHETLAAKCRALQADMLTWFGGYRADPTIFDGTIAGALWIYETHQDSPFHDLKPGSRRPYATYLRLLLPHIGGHHVSAVTALDVKRWHAVWSKGGKHPAAGSMALAVLKTALTFCIVAGHRQCRQLRDDISELRVSGPRPRKAFATADQVVAARRAAHAMGRPSGALCYAVQFETTLRLWDVAGQWFPLNASVMSTVLDGNTKWAGLEWRHIDENLVLRIKPSKTEGTTDAEIAVDLKLCPMVLEEIAHIHEDCRHGPMIVHERHRRPYRARELTELWKIVRRRAGLPTSLWCRDLRASAITEARDNGALTDDASKVAGHSKPRITAAVYDRSSLEAHRRFAVARVAKRGGNDVGNE
ncbi:integrase [Methylobacterium sp. W2]|uniref:integrase n=1 Tax=Methylobacterium sp. W2 TaxID=2598107 RepID=UPI001D0CACBF|nr:integrase [Methylobacterium sp. W2]MCC0806541.1 integrase [Methylobacterium sp. W2]